MDSMKFNRFSFYPAPGFTKYLNRVCNTTINNWISLVILTIHFSTIFRTTQRLDAITILIITFISTY